MAISHKPRTRRSLVFAVLCLLLLGTLVGLQAHWLGQLEHARRAEEERVLSAGAERMAVELADYLRNVAKPADPGAANVAWAEIASEVDLDTLQEKVAPALARRAFGQTTLDDYYVAIVAVSGDQVPLYRSDPAMDFEGRADASAPVPLSSNGWTGFFADENHSWQPVELALATPPDAAFSPWRIEVRHRSGSLEIALAQARFRNFMLGAGVLVLLAAGLALFWIGEQRARRLAEKELAFVAGVSHELRTPLTVIRTAASNLGEGVVQQPHRVAEYGEMIDREARRMGDLVERVLRFSNRGETQSPREKTDVREAIDGAVERCGAWVDRKQFDVDIHVEPDVPPLIGDRAGLVSALQNLLENAIKYGPDGQTVHVRAMRQTTSRGNELVVEIEDHGPGVEPRERSRVFEPFYRGAAARDATVPGTGLGLSVVTDVARAHGGSVSIVDGAPGATFALRLPLNGTSTS